MRLLFGLAAVAVVAAASPASADSVIVRCARPCTQAIAAVTSNGGTVTYRYKYVNAIAAEAPPAALAAVRAALGAGAVRKDVLVDVPASARDRSGSEIAATIAAESATALDAAEIAAMAEANPSGYRINNVNLNLTALHANGFAGQNMRVALIDSGIRPGFPHISLDNSVIGGEDFVNDGRGFSHTQNGPHGTQTAGMISANVVFTTGLAGLLAPHCPSCIGPAANQVAMIGSAPASRIYALRVFPPTGGAPESRIIAAMERVIELRENYDATGVEAGVEGGAHTALNIKVCNMSLGGGTLHAGRDIEDELTRAFLDHDIVLVAAAGNDGPSGSTVSSPGTGYGTLTVGASSSPVHERLLRDLQSGAGIGVLYRPFNAEQMAYFSSRGPNADGRTGPHVVANGFASFVQGSGTAGTLGFASGTSFASPTVAGIAAVLRQRFPEATARQIRNAIIAGANPSILADGSTPFDQGRGYVDAGASAALLASGAVADSAGEEGGDNRNVAVNLGQGANVQVFSGNVTRSAAGLLPGQRFETYYKVTPNTGAVIVTLSNVTPGAVQNTLFGDDILLAIQDARTSVKDYMLPGEVVFTGGGTFVASNPEGGLMRVTVSGDWTNASPIGATVNIRSANLAVPGQTRSGSISEGQDIAIPFTVKAGTASLDALLEWREDWGSYPSNDLDLILVPPVGAPNVAGAGFGSPERATIANPVAGTWTAIVSGFALPSDKNEKYTLRLAADGVVIK
jgi:subtilisin family serine protease